MATTSLTELRSAAESLDREVVCKLFPAAFTVDPVAACTVLTRTVEGLIKTGKVAPIKEITLLYSFITGQNDPKVVQLSDVVKIRSLPKRFAIFLDSLRVYALRSIIMQKTESLITTDVLLDLSKRSDSGKLAVIDFILTRRQPTAELVTTLNVVVPQLTNAHHLNEKRHTRIQKLNALFASQNLLKLALTSNLDMTKLQLLKSTPQQLSEWIEELRQNKYELVQPLPDPRKRVLSVMLANTGAYFKQHPVIVDIWSFSIEIETLMSLPSQHIFSKVQRLVMTLDMYSSQDFSVLIPGLQMCIQQAGITKNSRFTDEQLCMFAGISGALMHEHRLLVLLKYLRPHDSSIAQLLIMMLSLSPVTNFLSPNEGNKLMAYAINEVPKEFYIELELAYASKFDTLFDRERMLSIMDDCDDATRSAGICILAKTSSSEEETYKWCAQLVSLSSLHPLSSEIIKEYAFADLAQKLGIALHIDDLVQPVHKVMASLEAAKSTRDVAVFIDFLLRAWYTLKNAGCYSDALRYLNAALQKSEEHFGALSVRRVTCQVLLDEFTETADLPDYVKSASNAFVNMFLLIPSKLDLFSASFEESMNAFSGRFESVLCSSPLIASTPNAKLARQMRKTLKQLDAVDLESLTWREMMALSYKSQWLTFMNAWNPVKLGRYAQKLQPFYIQGRPIYSSRALHTEIEQLHSEFRPPSGTICVSLNFDEHDVLCVTRFQEDCEPVTLRLPPTRAHISISYLEAVHSIDDIVKRSVNVDTSNITAKQFWSHQAEFDAELKTLLNSLEECWFGGFTGITAWKLECSNELVNKVNNCFGNNRKKCNLTPLVVSLLWHAKNREDIVRTILCQKLHGMPMEDSVRLATELDKIFGEFSAQNDEKFVPVLLVCDRKAAAIPWESFPLFAKRSVTRAVSLDQVSEWMNAVPDTSEEMVTYVVNPLNDLPPTHQSFVQEFKLRGWRGVSGTKPAEETVLSQIKQSDCFIYMGHGSGKCCIRGSSLRKMYCAPSSIYLLGCNSLRIRDPEMDDDALTEHAVSGSRIIVGTLWAVKDKDFNRFSRELLTRVFDEGETYGPALCESRKACVLPYLTGGAAVVYGLSTSRAKQVAHPLPRRAQYSSSMSLPTSAASDSTPSSHGTRLTSYLAGTSLVSSRPGSRPPSARSILASTAGRPKSQRKV